MEGVEPMVVCILAAKCNPNSFAPSRSHTAEDGTAIYNAESPPLFVHSGSPLMSAVRGEQAGRRDACREPLPRSCFQQRLQLRIPPLVCLLCNAIDCA